MHFLGVFEGQYNTRNCFLLKAMADSCLKQNNVTFAKDQKTNMNLSRVGLLFEMRKTKKINISLNE